MIIVVVTLAAFDSTLLALFQLYESRVTVTVRASAIATHVAVYSRRIDGPLQ